MSQPTVSEQVVEDYLASQGIPFEPIPRSHFPTPDYRLLAKPEPVIVEVKEFGQSGKQREGGYCPVPFVRAKFEACWKQFEQYGDQACCLMLYNAGSTTVFLQPELILCAMFGEYRQRLGPDSYGFSGTAAIGPDKNTRVSGVAAFLPLRVDHGCIEAGRRVFQLTDGLSRDLSDDEAFQVHRETAHFGQFEFVVRAVVVENPFARKQLPQNIFNGPFDERWARLEDGSVRIKHSGARIKEMRTLLPDYALKMMGLW